MFEVALTKALEHQQDTKQALPEEERCECLQRRGHIYCLGESGDERGEGEEQPKQIEPVENVREVGAPE